MAELARCYDGELEVYEYAAFLNGRLIFSEPEVVGDRPVFVEPVHRACICDLRERETGELAVDGATVELPVLKHCKFITVYVE